jgi:hypothetical protein
VTDEESFRVTDRRGRAADRSSGSGPSPAPPSPQAGPDRAESPSAGDLPGEPGPAPSGSLAALCMMLTSSALVNLGAMPEPGTDQHHVDLPQAQAAIDMLLMLREKTHGNRTEPESRLLDDVLYDLQMRFVRAARAQPPRPAEP